jgi:hypothetical protein
MFAVSPPTNHCHTVISQWLDYVLGGRIYSCIRNEAGLTCLPKDHSRLVTDLVGSFPFSVRNVHRMMMPRGLGLQEHAVPYA